MTGAVLHLLRHGAPDVPGRMIGRTDVPSSAAGIAACVARAQGLRVDRIVTSDLCRAQAAGAAIAQASGNGVTADPRWRELDFGAWDGLAPAEIDGEALGRFWADPDRHAPPGGERWSVLVARVGAACDALPDGATLVLTHGGAMRAALAALCGFDHKQAFAFDLPYAALLSLRLWRGDTLTAQIVGLRA